MILTNYTIGYWPLQNPFIWNVGVPSRVFMNHNQSLDNIELGNLVRRQLRDIYVGPRVSCIAAARWQGNLQELQVGMLIVMLAGDNELVHPF